MLKLDFYFVTVGFAMLKQAVTLKYHYAAAHYVLGLALYDQGDKQDDITHLKRARELSKTQDNITLMRQVEQVLQELEVE
jgi:tetratricopeptide (TPR) repeat protein